MLEPGFFDSVKRMARLLRGKLEELVADYPEAVRRAARRRACCSACAAAVLTAGDVVAKLRGEGLLCLTAGDNVLRLLPPLIVGEREIDEGDGDHRQGRAGNGRAVANERRARGARGEATAGPPRHFLDLDRSTPASCAQILDPASPTSSGRRRPSRSTGKTLAMIFEKPSTRTRVSFEVGDAPARRRVDHARHARDSQLGRGETVADTARVLSRYVDAIMIRTNHAEKLDELARIRDRAGDQRPDRRDASLPDHGRRDDLRGATRADRRQGRRLERRRQQRRASAGSTPRCGSASSCGSPAPSSCGRRRRCSTGRGARAAGSRLHRRSGRGGAPAPIASSPTPGCRWATKPSVNRHNLLAPYRVDERLMASAKPDAIFMHCLPAQSRRGGHGRRHRRAAIGGLGRGGEPPARAEGHPRLVPGGNALPLLRTRWHARRGEPGDGCPSPDPRPRALRAEPPRLRPRCGRAVNAEFMFAC